MRLRPLVVGLLAVAAFLALYAIGQASEDGGDEAELVAPVAIERAADSPAEPPELDAGGALPSLKPARRRPPPRPAEPPAPEPEEEPEPEPEPEPAPPPAPAPAPPPPPPPPPPDPGQPFYDEG